MLNYPQFYEIGGHNQAPRRTGKLQLGQTGIDKEFSFCGRADQNSLFKSFSRLPSVQ